MTDDQIKHMVERFLGWKLPDNFSPDAGISFKAEFNEHTQWPMRHEPTGTNLFDYTQAEAMIRYMVEALSTPPQPEGGTVERYREALEKCRDQFQFYADEHSGANKPAKAATNQRFADLCMAALQPEKTK